MKGNGIDGSMHPKFVKIAEGALNFSMAEITKIHELIDARLPEVTGSSVSQRVQQLCDVFDKLVAVLSAIPDEDLPQEH